MDTYSDDNVPAVRIGIQNAGDRSLDRVEATVYFKNASDQTIFEKTYAVISDSAYVMDTHRRAPLKPGYVSEMGSDKYLTIDSTLSQWEEGNASIKITNLEFTPDPEPSTASQ